MEVIEIIKLLLHYAIVPLATVGWWLFKKQDFRLNMLEKRANELEKTISKIETEIKYISRDIKEIKEGINKIMQAQYEKRQL